MGAVKWPIGTFIHYIDFWGNVDIFLQYYKKCLIKRSFCIVLKTLKILEEKLGNLAYQLYNSAV